MITNHIPISIYWSQYTCDVLLLQQVDEKYTVYQNQQVSSYLHSYIYGWKKLDSKKSI